MDLYFGFSFEKYYLQIVYIFWGLCYVSSVERKCNALCSFWCYWVCISGTTFWILRSEGEVFGWILVWFLVDTFMKAKSHCSSYKLLLFFWLSGVDLILKVLQVYFKIFNFCIGERQQAFWIADCAFLNCNKIFLVFSGTLFTIQCLITNMEKNE